MSWGPESLCGDEIRPPGAQEMKLDIVLSRGEGGDERCKKKPGGERVAWINCIFSFTYIHTYTIYSICTPVHVWKKACMYANNHLLIIFHLL